MHDDYIHRMYLDEVTKYSHYASKHNLTNEQTTELLEIVASTIERFEPNNKEIRKEKR